MSVNFPISVFNLGVALIFILRNISLSNFSKLDFIVVNISLLESSLFYISILFLIEFITYFSSKIGLFTYFNVEVNIMNERRVIGVVVDAGHGGIGLSQK